MIWSLIFALVLCGLLILMGLSTEEGLTLTIGAILAIIVIADLYQRIP